MNEEFANGYRLVCHRADDVELVYGELQYSLAGGGGDDDGRVSPPRENTDKSHMALRFTHSTRRAKKRGNGREEQSKAVDKHKRSGQEEWTRGEWSG